MTVTGCSYFSGVCEKSDTLYDGLTFGGANYREVSEKPRRINLCGSKFSW
jgi:hypothetical protein